MATVPEIMHERMAIFISGREALMNAGVPYIVGGGLAVGCYGHQRVTKDIDFFIEPEYAEEGIEALHDAGFRIKRSDPIWLYQSWKEDTLVDLVFRINTSRGRFPVDAQMLARGCDRLIFGERFRVIAPEDLLIIKVLVQHENRSDWWDAITIMRNPSISLDWNLIRPYADIDPVKVLSFLLFTHSRHISEELFPRWFLEDMWSKTAESLSLTPSLIY